MGKLFEEIFYEFELELIWRLCSKEMSWSRCDIGCKDDNGESKIGLGYVYVFINNINVIWCIYKLFVM